MDAFDQRTFIADKQMVKLLGTIKGAPTALAATETVETASSEFSTQFAVVASDIPVALIKPTFQAHMFIAGPGRVAAAADYRAWFGDANAAGVTPTASEVYTLIVLR